MGAARILGLMNATDSQAPEGLRGRDAEAAPTDELSGVDPGSRDSFSVPLVELGAQAEEDEDFEHRRAVASARMALFGVAPRLSIGRYEIERRLGAGGMGEVYLGTDPELERYVAIKRVLPGRGGERDQARLKREAKALARLAHPNVVRVYDSGEHQGRVFLAMEYVPGHTLEDWLSEGERGPRGRRGWREIVETFIRAGRGLAAAHAADIVHRDFKPENVLIGEDGEVRVADFGLAFATASERPSSVPGRATGGPSSLAASVVSGVAGTIRYMPLEQLRGESVDARSDQFAFCVALYEALFGMPPYALGTVHRRVDALEAQALQKPELDEVPRALWRALRRGLSVHPNERWPQLDELLEALERCLYLRRRVALVAGVFVGVLGLGAGVSLATEAPSCEPAAVAAELAGTWDADTRAALQAQLAPLEFEVEHAADSSRRLLAGLDAWAQRWTEDRIELCEARASGALAPELARLRGQCLAQHEGRVARFVQTLLDQPLEARDLGGAIEAVAELPSPASCSAYALGLLEPPPEAIAAEVARVREDVFLASELRLLGRFEPSRSLIEQAEERAMQLDYEPLAAEALAQRAKLEFNAGTGEQGAALLLDAIDLAEGSRHDQLAAELWSVASMRASGFFSDAEQAQAYLRRARSAWRRIEPEPRYEAMLAYVEGQIAQLEGKYEVAGQAYQRALGLLEPGPAAERADYLSASARTLELRGMDEALEFYERALNEAEQYWGPHHVAVAGHAINVGVALQGQGEAQSERSQALLERAARLLGAAHERPSRGLAEAEKVLAFNALAAGEVERAREHAERLQQLAKVYPAGSPERAYPDIFLGRIFALREQRAEALVHVERAIAQLEREARPGDPRLLEQRSEQASHLLALGRLDEAERSYDALIDATVEQAPEATVPAFLGLAELRLRRGQAERAKDALEDLRRLELEPVQLSGYALAWALLDALAELRRGGELEAKLPALAAALADSPYTAEQLDAWYDDLELGADERRALGL